MAILQQLQELRMQYCCEEDDLQVVALWLAVCCRFALASR